MVNTFPNAIIYNFQETSFIAGTYKELYFDLYTSGSHAIDVRSSVVSWTLSPYDCKDYVILTKSPQLYNGYFMVPLLSTDSIGLSGKYIQKASIAGSFGYAYNVGQGILYISPANGGS